MSSYSESYRDTSSGWGDFLGFMVWVVCIIIVGRMIVGWGMISERQRIEKLLAPYGVTIEHLEKQAEIAKEKQISQPITNFIMKGDAK